MTDDEIATELSQLSDLEIIKIVELADDHRHSLTRREELALDEAGWRELEF